MLNSLSVFAAFLAFLLFGYLSFLRLLAKHHLKTSESNLETGQHKQSSRIKQGADLIRNLGSSAFFVSLPATALLLFWGWGPALIWLVVFHFLVESIFQLQFSAQKPELTVADHLLRTDKGIFAVLEQGLIQAFFLLSMAVVVALVATLLDRQPGLLFALLFLLPARQLISHTSAAIPAFVRIGGGLGLMALGLAFSDQLGFSVYGDWAPLGASVPWLVFNMPTLIAAIIVVAVFNLEQNHGFKRDLSFYAGLIIVLLVCAMIVKLIWLRPILDAPLNASQQRSDDLPYFISLSLFIFAGFAALLIRLLNEEENGEQRKPVQYLRLQSGSFIHVVYMALLVLSLAAALGIGAWKTHFIDWSTKLNILDYLNLSISSNLNLIYNYADSGTMLHTVLLASLCFTGFSFLLMCANQLTLEESDKESVWSLVVEAKIPQAIGIFVLSAYFIGNGISINAWLLIGVLAWVLFVHLCIGMCLRYSKSGLFSAITIGLLVFGTLQILALSWQWLMSENYLLLAMILIILVVSYALWAKDLKPLVKKLTQSEKDAFL